MTTPDLVPVVERVVQARAAIPAGRALLVAVSGIDGCGKGYLTGRLAAAVRARGLAVAPLNVDGWLNLPKVRFSAHRPAEHFYAHAIRFEDMFDQLVLPLRDRRRVRVTVDFAEETATGYRKHEYDLQDVEVILLEGIYLLKEAFRPHYDLSVWIDCSFETALERAVARAQEGLAPEDTLHAYRTIYFPAQEIHFRRDHPRRAAACLVDNDSRPAARAGAA